MSEDLTVSTPEEYTRLTTRKIAVPSGAVFNIRAMGANAMVYLIGIMPDEGVEGEKELVKFTASNLDGIETHIVKPCIIAPKVEHLAFTDVVRLLVELMDLSGFAEKGNPFPDSEDGGGA